MTAGRSCSRGPVPESAATAPGRGRGRPGRQRARRRGSTISTSSSLPRASSQRRGVSVRSGGRLPSAEQELVAGPRRAARGRRRGAQQPDAGGGQPGIQPRQLGPAERDAHEVRRDVGTLAPPSPAGGAAARAGCGSSRPRPEATGWRLAQSGSGRPIGLGKRIVPAAGDPSGQAGEGGDGALEGVVVDGRPTARRRARRSVARCRRGGFAPRRWRHRRRRPAHAPPSRSAAADQSSSLHPRAGCVTSRGVPPVAAASTWAPQPSMPCGDQRCVVPVAPVLPQQGEAVPQGQEGIVGPGEGGVGREQGSAGDRRRGHHAVAAPRPSARGRRRWRRRPSTSWSAASRRRVRASSASAGVAIVHTSGRARATIDGCEVVEGGRHRARADLAQRAPPAWRSSHARTRGCPPRSHASADAGWK